MASSNSPCAACKFLRRKCTQECVFAPYFPPDQPQKFSNVHKVFGASNVAKLLNDLPSPQREDAVNSLAYEAEMRLRDPVYGCVGIISVLQHSLKQIQHELYNARKELATYIGPSAMHPLVLPTHNPQILHHHQNASSSMGVGGGPFGGMSQMGLGMPPPGPSSQSQILIREQQQQQQMLEAQQIAAMAAREQQEQLLRSYEQQQQELVRYNSGGFDGNSASSGGVFNHMSAGLSSNLALVPMDNSFQIQQQSQQQQELLHHQQTPQTNQNHQELQVPHQQQRAGSDEGNSGIVGPSS